MASTEIRVIHTSDVHLDASFRKTGLSSRHARERCQAHLEAFEQVLEKADDLKAHVLAVAGDLFEGQHVRPATGRHVARLLEDWQRPVFLAPGNHDPVVDGSLYRLLEWSSNVHIFGGVWSSVLLPELNLTVHGRGFTAPEDHDRLFNGLKVEGKGHHLVVAHGSDLSGHPEGHAPYRPFVQDEIDRLPVAYVALGHYHGFQVLKTSSVPAAYCGSPIPQGFKETGDHGVVLATIREDETRIQFLPLNARQFVTLKIKMRKVETQSDVIESIRTSLRSKEVQEDFVRVVLQGTLPSDLDLDLEGMRQTLKIEVHSLDLIDQTLPEYDTSMLAKEETVRGRYVRALLKELENADEPRSVIIKKAILFGLDAFAGHRQAR